MKRVYIKFVFSSDLILTVKGREFKEEKIIRGRVVFRDRSVNRFGL